MGLFKKKSLPRKDANFYIYFSENQKDVAEEFARTHEDQFVAVKVWLSVTETKNEWGVKLNRLVSGIDEYHAVGADLKKDAEKVDGDFDGSEIQA